MKKNIKSIVNNVLNETDNNQEKNEELENLKIKYSLLEEKINYIDANLKGNYILPLLVINYFLLSILFDFQKYLNISNIFSTIIFSIIVSLFFYNENKIISKKILQKIFLKR